MIITNYHVIELIKRIKNLKSRVNRDQNEAHLVVVFW